MFEEMVKTLKKTKPKPRIEPTFSIIIPSFNQAEFLPDAIDSALNQIRKADEVIVIDDGSTDGSFEIAKKYPVKVIAQVNKGLASARNTGIMNAVGEYIIPLDADDMLMDNYIEKVREIIMEHDADVVAPSFKCFGLSNNSVILSEFSGKSLSEANRIGYFSTIRKSKLLEVGGYSPRMTWGWEDYHLWLDLFKRSSKFVVTNDVLVLYRVKQQSMIHEANKHAEELMAQIKKDHKIFYE